MLRLDVLHRLQDTNNSNSGSKHEGSSNHSHRPLG
jgi:hypothetical protein